LQQIVRKELEGTKLEISVAQLWLHLAIWYQAYYNVGVRLLSWSNLANQSLPVSSKPKRKMGAVTNTNNAKQFGFQIELLKDMEVEHWCFGCVLKGKQGRRKAFQSLMYKLLHLTGSWRTCHLSTVNLIYRTCLTSHQLRQLCNLMLFKKVCERARILSSISSEETALAIPIELLSRLGQQLLRGDMLNSQ